MQRSDPDTNVLLCILRYSVWYRATSNLLPLEGGGQRGKRRGVFYASVDGN